MKGNLHALFLCSWYPNRIEPTAGNFIQKHAEAVALYCKVSTLSVCSDAEMKVDYEVETIELKNVFSVNVYYKKVDSRIPVIKYFLKPLRYYKAFRTGYKKVLEIQGKPDIIHVNKALPIGLFAVFFNSVKGMPYVVTEHWTAYLKMRRNELTFLEKFISKFIFNQASYVMPVSANLADSLKEIGVRSSFRIIPNVVDVHTFFYDSNSPQNKKRLLHISTLKDEQKNISGILRVVKKLSETKNDFYLTIVSDGELAPHVEYATSLNILNSYVFFESTKSTSEVAAMLRQSDALVLFSNYENFPCVIPEALASGIPVVSTNVNGIPEHINESNGILVDARDEDGLTDALMKIIDLKVNFDANQLRRYAVEHFSYEAVGKSYYDVYCNVLKQSW